MTLQLLLTTALVASAHSTMYKLTDLSKIKHLSDFSRDFLTKHFCSESQPYCSGGRICVQEECRRYKPNIDCNATGGRCPRGYCCMSLDSSLLGTCVRKLNLRLQLGDFCNRQRGCDYCQCEQALVCAKAGFQFFPGAIYTCQENDTEGECNDDEQCASDRCCSSKKCKPKRREGERCYPKNASFWEAYLECNGDCEDGTACTRDKSGPSGYYVCQAVGAPSNICR